MKMKQATLRNGSDRKGALRSAETQARPLPARDQYEANAPGAERLFPCLERLTSRGIGGIEGGQCVCRLDGFENVGAGRIPKPRIA